MTATKLIKQFGNIENIYLPENLKTLPERTQRLLAEGAESAVMSKSLATLDLNAPIKLDLKKCVVHNYDKNRVINLFEELEFRTLVKKVTGMAKDPLSNGDSVTGPTAPVSQVLPQDEVPAVDVQELSSVSPVNNIQTKKIIKLDTDVEKVLQQMTKTGILVDKNFLEKLGLELKKRLSEIEKEVFHFIGHEFNLNSPKQLADILFDELNLPVIRRTKTGRSTDEATLLELKDSHPVIPLLLEYRQLFKLVSTYVDALPKSIGEDGRIHSTFNVEGAATGRLSSTNPNLQNIPIKGEIGGEIRKAFIAETGKVLLGADYSQIELRIMAHLANDPGLKHAFDEGLDIHATTASKIFNVPIDDVTKQMRMVGKTMNFATLYGQGPHALSQQLGVEYGVARQYIVEYFEEFPKVKDWMEQVLADGYKNGYVETIWGRRRYIPELNSSNRMLKSAGERAAINHPVQGTSADMIKQAMIDIDKELNDANLESKIVLQIHDELLFEVDPKDLEFVSKLVKNKMENALKLSVPVKVDLKIGNNWGEMKPLDI